MEKLAPKEKGIISQSVKEVLDSLVADNLVVSDKIGTSNYFWSFPSSFGVQVTKIVFLIQRKTEKEKLESKFKELCDSEMQMKGEILMLSEGRQETEDRKELLLTVAQLETQSKELNEKLKKYSENDPETLKAMKKSCDIARLAANRWTGLIFFILTCRKYFSN